MTYQITTEPLPGVLARPGTGCYGVFDHGAHVWAWQPDGARPVLWLSEHSRFAEGQAVRGGVPLIFPWFGPGPQGGLKPAHGFARTSVWSREAIAELNGDLTVRYRLDDSMVGEQPNFPHPFSATLTVGFSAAAVDVAFGVTNTGTVPFTYEDALHTYLAVGDILGVSVEGLDAMTYYDKTAADPAAPCLQDGPVTFARETDRIYVDDSGGLLVVDPSWSRQIRVEKSGSANTVVWNPWTVKAAAMADFGDEEWPTMLCVEAANIGANAVTLAPGETHVTTQRVSLG